MDRNETYFAKALDKLGIKYVFRKRKTRIEEHEWIVFSTAIMSGCLMLKCKNCGAYGTVDDPSADEWADGYYAPLEPYRWNENARVRSGSMDELKNIIEVAIRKWLAKYNYLFSSQEIEDLVEMVIDEMDIISTDEWLGFVCEGSFPFKEEGR